MERPAQSAFLLLIVVQTAHSVEEYVTRLFDVFAPARLVSSLVSSDLAFGFLIANLALIAFGFWCWVFPVRLQWPSSRALAWGWAIVELGNGIGHSTMALARGGYFPGVITAPGLLLSSGWLMNRLLR
jgi:hypothetical protein